MSNPAHNFSVTASRVVAASRVIGEVLAASGSCRLTRADVGAIQVRVGDSVYQGDLIETAADGRIIIRFLDGTTFDLCDNARMELDEFVCNSDGTPHSGLLTLARGAFRLIAGHMVKAGRLRIDTPVASIRGRGPAGAFGSLSLTALILSVISEAQASSDHTSQHNDVIAYKDLDLNGNFDLTLPNGTVVNVGDPGETVTITDSLDITYSTNSSSQMEDYQSAQRETVSYLSLGLSGPTSTGPIGSPTLFGNPLPLQPINFTPPDPNQTLPPIFNTSPQPGANPPDPAGVRHAPVLTAAAADLIETNAGLKISGAITVTDLDNDIIGVSVTSVAVDETNSTGPLDGRPDIPTLKAMLSLAQGTIVAAPSAQLGWSFDSGPEAFNYLAKDETLTLVYQVRGSDFVEADTKTVTITITGTNDRPVITSTDSELSGTITETTGQTGVPTEHSVGGVLNYAELDVTDLDHINHGNATAVWIDRFGTSHTVTDPAIIDAGRLLFGLVDQDLNSATWTYTVADDVLDFLAAGESLTVTYIINVQDDSGDAATATSTTRQIVINFSQLPNTGTNDRPVITSTVGELSDTIIETVAQTDDPTDHSVDGVVNYTDVDVTDVDHINHTTATAVWTHRDNTTSNVSDTDIIGASRLVFGSVDQNLNTATWTYTVADNELDFLGADETLVVTYDITVQDDSGSANDTSLPRQITVTITGTNDRPVISVTDVAGAVIEDANIVADNPNTAAVETGSFLHDTGSISFTDVDTTDLSAATVALTGTPSTTGPAIPAALSTALANAVLLSGATTNAHSGTVDWSFALDDSLVQYLAKGETVTATYTISVKDDSGDAATDTATQTVTVTITGTNDTPVLAAVTGPTHTDTTNDDTFAAATGTLTSTDVDVNDSATYGIDTGTTGGNTNLGGVIYDVSKAGTYGTLYVNSTTGAWRFEANDGAIEGLKGDTTENFTVKVTDGSGATASQTFTVTLDGANDTPVLAVVTGPTYTDTANDDTFAATTGTLARTDRDTGDSATYGIDTGTTGGNTNLGGVIYDVSKGGTYGTLYVNSTTGAWRFEANDGAIEGLNGDTTENFTVKVTDGSGATASQTFTATLDGANDTPVAVADTIYTNVGFGDSISVNDAWLLLNDTDRDSSTLTISSVADGFIADASHSGTTTTVTPNVLPPIFPVFPFFGTSTFTYTVSDGSLSSAATTVTIHRGFHNATITGGSGNDILIEGRNTATTLDGGTGLDIIIGGGAGDTIIGAQDDILLDGRGGTDVLKVDENFTSTSDSQIVNIEKILLTDDVTLNISNQTEGFIITSSSGADTITGGAGGDTIVARIDNVRDVIDGGAGSDTADYSAYTAGLTVTLNGATPAIVVGSSVPGNDIVHADTIANIENFVGGSRKDVITGDGNANVITGGGGGDLLAGGGGSDTFVFKSVSNSSPGTTGGNPNYDVINDFVHGSDFLDFSAISGLNSAVQPVIIQSASAPTTIAAHTIDIVTSGGNTVIYANASNVSHTIGAADIEIHLSNVTNVTASDFILHH